MRHIHDESPTVDLGLPSGTLWLIDNEPGYHTWAEALNAFGRSLPTKEQVAELIKHCRFHYDCTCCRVVATGPNGNRLPLPLMGAQRPGTHIDHGGRRGFIWAVSGHDEPRPYCFQFWSHGDTLMPGLLCTRSEDAEDTRYCVRCVVQP